MSEKEDEIFKIEEQRLKYEQYMRGTLDDDMNEKDIKIPQIRNKIIKHRNDIVSAAKSATKSELLHTVERGFIKSDHYVTQREIKKAIPVSVASKAFDMKFSHGPYCINVDLAGKYVIYGGDGEYGAFNMFSGAKIGESVLSGDIRSCCFLHNETQAAFATSKNLYISSTSKDFTLLHDIQEARNAFAVTFLHKFFNVVSVTRNNRLVYIDVTNGKINANFYTKHPPTSMCQNKSNGVIALGHDNGQISLWTPNQNEAVVQLYRHPSRVNAVDIDLAGNYLAAGHGDGNLQIWDLRSMKRIQQNQSNYPGITDVRFSATGVLGVSRNNYFELYQTFQDRRAYLKHKFSSKINNFVFTMFDDFALFGLEDGIASLVVPGVGEPNIDINIANPFGTVRFRQEKEVRDLLDKLPIEMISQGNIFQVGVFENKRKKRADELRKKAIIKDIEPGEIKDRKNFEQRIAMMKDEYLKEKLELKRARIKAAQEQEEEEEKPVDPLDRFS